MPIINIKVSGERDADQSQQIAGMVTDLTCSILGKKRDLIAIVVQYVSPEDWIVAGRSLALWQKASFYLDIKITDETNTKDQKADFIRRVFDGFANLLGPIHEESYIHVEDERAAAYGFGGRTQEYRYQHS